MLLTTSCLSWFQALRMTFLPSWGLLQWMRDHVKGTACQVAIRALGRCKSRKGRRPSRGGVQGKTVISIGWSGRISLGRHLSKDGKEVREQVRCPSGRECSRLREEKCRGPQFQMFPDVSSTSEEQQGGGCSCCGAHEQERTKTWLGTCCAKGSLAGHRKDFGAIGWTWPHLFSTMRIYC